MRQEADDKKAGQNGELKLVISERNPTLGGVLEKLGRTKGDLWGDI